MTTYLRSLWRCQNAFDAWRLYQSKPMARASRPTTGDAQDEPGEPLDLDAATELLIRPIRVTDADAMQRAFKRLTPEQVRSRFFHTLKELPAAVATAMCDIDPDTTISLVATDPDGIEIRGEARVYIDSVTESAEFALAIDPGFTGKGLGQALLSRLISECRDRQLNEIWGETQSDNMAMLALARTVGFDRQGEPGNATHIRMRMSLQDADSPRRLAVAA